MWPFSKKEAPRLPPIIDARQNMSRVYPEDTITPLRFKQLCKLADQGQTFELMELFDACATDYKVASVLRTLKLSVAAAPSQCKPMMKEPTDQDKAVADEAQDFVDSIPSFIQMKMDLLDAYYRGFAAGRCVYERIEGDDLFAGQREMITAWQPIESRFFQFREGEYPEVMTLDRGGFIPLPPEYLFFTVRDKPGPVLRGGIGRSIAKMWLYKGYYLIDMASYIEKYGQPHVQVTIPKHYVEGSVELERAKSAARALISDNIGLVPEGVVVELMESIKQTSNVKDVYLAAIQFCDEAIAMAALGHTLTSGASSVGGLGHGGEAQQAADVKQEIKEFVGLVLEEFLNYRILWPRHQRMYGDAVKPPWLCIDVDEPEDQVEIATANKLRAETIQILASAGMEISKEQQYRDFGLDKPTGDDVMKAPAPQVPVGPDGQPIQKGPMPPGVPGGKPGAAPVPGKPPTDKKST